MDLLRLGPQSCFHAMWTTSPAGLDGSAVGSKPPAWSSQFASITDGRPHFETDCSMAYKKKTDYKVKFSQTRIAEKFNNVELLATMRHVNVDVVWTIVKTSGNKQSKERRPLKVVTNLDVGSVGLGFAATNTEARGNKGPIMPKADQSCSSSPVVRV